MSQVVFDRPVPGFPRPMTRLPQPALCTDLDGSLIATDALWEQVMLLARHQPLALLRLPLWLRKGKAYLKHEIASRAKLNVAALPYREEVLSVIREQRKAGRRTILATAADASVAHAVADHVGLFDEVVASDGRTNMSGENKLRAIRSMLGSDTQFDYIGDSPADMPLFRECNRPMVVTHRRGMLKRSARHCDPTEIACPGSGSRGRYMVKALRPQQWSKNVLLAVPLVVSHSIGDWGAMLACLIAIVAFSLVASTVYLVNDLFDLEADRLHPTKCRRPFAAGRLSIPTGLGMIPGLLAMSAALCVALLPWKFGAMLVGYLVLSLTYTLFFKRKMLVDVFCLAGLYTLRILAGAAAIGVMVSPWLLAFSMFLFLSLAFVKRYSELKLMKASEKTHARGRGYMMEDLETFLAVGPTSGYLAVLVLCLYINSPDVLKLYRQPAALWMVCPVLLYWITRMWFLVRRYELADDPVSFALQDKVSYLAGLTCGLIIMAATLL